MKWLRAALALIVLSSVVGLATWMWSRSAKQRAVAPRIGEVSAEALRDPALIARGAYLTTVGGCAGCHTVRGGASFAGGRPIPTPFGNVPTSNLTPDPETGLGRWSFTDFWHALHDGKGPGGKLLYPAFPYTSYTRVATGDALAIFAYLRSLPAVRQAPQPATLAFPYNLRWTLAAWRALYFRRGVFQPDPKQSAQWNRGAYLVQGLGHCNECHARRNAWGATSGGSVLAGGEIPRQDWYAPDLSTQENGGLRGWTGQDVVALLKNGQAARGATFGPMADVVEESTQHMTDADLRAIATHLVALPPRPVRQAPRSAFNVRKIVAAGEQIYRKRCADCHGDDGKGVAGVYPPLDGNAAVTEPTGINAIRTVLLGGFPPVTAGNLRPYSMPANAQQLNDSDVALVVSYIRQAWTNQASVVRPEQVARYRHTPID
ncbi:MAG: cytochrome c [Rhodanobacter sp.]